MMRLFRVAIVVALLAGLVVATQQWVARRSAARDESAAPRPRPAPLVRTMEVDPTHLVEQRTFPAEVRASATVDIVSRIPGRLGAVLVREGSFVNAGGLVARLDDPDITLAVTQAEAAVAVQRARLAQLKAGPRAPEVAHVEAQIAQQEAALAQAERDLARAQQLFSEGLVARAAVDRAQTDVDLARARVRQSREQLAVLTHGPRPEDVEAQIAQVRQAEVQLAQARARLRELRITSPIAGVVTRLNVESGAVISSQTVLATVATIQPIEVHVLLPETDLPRLRKTSTVRITVDAIPERVFEGRIARVAPTLESATRSARLIVVVPNADAALRPGMFARATVVFDERQAIVIPSDAIVRRGEAAVVFVVKGDTVEERPVGIGYVEGGRTEIVEGLASGEAVVVAGQQGLRDGMKVRTGSGPPGPPGGPPGQTAPPSPGGGSSRP
jgi:multidrug efflux pump subunit AcrA (membrane-fusion protein)